MRTLPCSTPWSRCALLFVVFCALLAVPLLAQAGPAADNPSAAGFLASLSAAPASSNAISSVQTPAPIFFSGCTSNSQCPTGQLCCLACGYAGCDTRACFQPMNGHCPFFP